METDFTRGRNPESFCAAVAMTLSRRFKESEFARLLSDTGRAAGVSRMKAALANGAGAPSIAIVGAGPGGLAMAAGHHACEPALDDGFGVVHDAPHQFGAGRDVVDQSLHLAGRPDAFIGIAGRIDHFAPRAGDEFADILELGAGLLHLDHLGADGVFGDARGVAKGWR